MKTARISRPDMEPSRHGRNSPGIQRRQQGDSGGAKQVLAPLGIKRKDRSRTWLDDHGWWLGIVEFQPSSWGAGSYLNVGPTFLWRSIGRLVLEGRYRLDDFSQAADASSFRQAIQVKAAKAEDKLTVLRKRFASLRDMARHYETAGRALSMTDQAGVAWARRPLPPRPGKAWPPRSSGP